jgi:hypothetical protein
MKPYHNELLITLLTQPTALFREQHVTAWVKAVLDEEDVPHFAGPIGNIMDGGACEGTVATVYGVPTIALAVPLGNDRNQRLQGDPIAVA